MKVKQNWKKKRRKAEGGSVNSECGKENLRTQHSEIRTNKNGIPVLDTLSVEERRVRVEELPKPRRSNYTLFCSLEKRHIDRSVCVVKSTRDPKGCLYCGDQHYSDDGRGMRNGYQLSDNRERITDNRGAEVSHAQA